MERIEELDETSDIQAVVAAVRNRADEIRGNLGPKGLWEERVERADELLEIADRIEAAAKRETVPGNSAKMREAIGNALWCLNWMNENTGDKPTKDHLAKPIELLLAALAAPPRNCDVGTVAEQNERYKRFCTRHYQANNVDAQCDACLCKEERWDCELEWAQMPYAAQEGGDHADA